MDGPDRVEQRANRTAEQRAQECAAQYGLQEGGRPPSFPAAPGPRSTGQVRPRMRTGRGRAVGHAVGGEPTAQRGPAIINGELRS